MDVLGTNYTERKDASNAIINIYTSLNSFDPMPLGQYRGFSLFLQYDAVHTDYKIGRLSHTVSLSADAGGNITRMDNVVDGMEKTLETLCLVLAEVKTQLANQRQKRKPLRKGSRVGRKVCTTEETEYPAEYRSERVCVAG